MVTILRAFYFCTQGCGCIGHPAFPAPSVFRLSNAHIFFGLRSLVETDSLVGVGLAEDGFMSMEVGLGRFGDRRLEKGGRRCMRPSFDVQAPAFDALQGTGPKRFGSRVFCAMKG